MRAELLGSIGSSPRRRGEVSAPPVVHTPPRFIPAQTGRGSSRPTAPASTPVHPRADGERLAWSRSRSAVAGSSPRRRGEGQSPSSTSWRSGSSPRRRGEGQGDTPRGRPARFIPAQTGRGSGRYPSGAARSVHPRADGERSSNGDPYLGGGGSSPRRRGEGEARWGFHRARRFIPAQTGRGTRWHPPAPTSTVHPRADGERNRAQTSISIRPGSSPRRRGEVGLVRPGLHRHRFIPAQTGRGQTCRRGSPSPPVHPRADGERAVRSPFQGHHGGSSPRRRGEGRALRELPGRVRFIPAQTGRGPAPTGRTSSSAVHPRADGERFGNGGFQGDFSGSSPRRRGEVDTVDLARGNTRFIPAQTGRGHRASSTPSTASVHPRADGERTPNAIIRDPTCGSSPRRRGEGEVGRALSERVRFIPAQTGRGDCHRGRGSDGPVHPRADGERVSGPLGRRDPRGSSPRRRGEGPLWWLGLQEGRFIPAQTGRGLRRAAGEPPRPVHPRADGERGGHAATADLDRGSSPRRRGEVSRPPALFPRRRFIPAQTGRGRRPRRGGRGRPVHPRADGERAGVDALGEGLRGSSPRRRGEADAGGRSAQPERFIPAQTGRGPTRSPPSLRAAVHPRADGERGCVGERRPERGGSSPRRRGEALPATAAEALRRFIPAQTGRGNFRRWTASGAPVHPRADGERATTRAPTIKGVGSSPRRRGEGQSPCG